MKEELISNIKAVNKFIFYCYNFEHDFIQKVWKDDPWLASHLDSKFKAAYRNEGAYGAMLSFYAELDSSNKAKLLAYILENYNDEQEIRGL